MSIEPLNNRIQQLERLLEVGRNLSAMLDLEPLLQTIIDAAAELTFSQEASILLYDKDQENLEFVATPWFKRDEMTKVRVPLDKSIAGQVFSYGEPILVKDAKEDERVYREVDQYTGFETKSLLVVPMFFKGTSTGVLSAVNKLGDLHYTEEDINILKNLASQASIAIQNARQLHETQKAFSDLSEVDRMKTDFIAITSHELRTPLGLILGHGTFLMETIPEELKSQMTVIVNSALRLKSIVEDLSKVNSFQTGQSRVRWNKVDIKTLLKEITENHVEQALAKKVKLNLETPDEELSVECEEEKIGIALSHLVRNAVSFSEDYGQVLIKALRLSGYVRIEVTDEGIGIPKKDLPRIFDRFFQVEEHMTRSHGGMGLGLSVAKMMVEMHNGRIGVQSEEGKGTTFSILLPATTEESERLPSLP